MSTGTRPADFDAYWDAVDEELARYPANAALEPAPRRSTEFATAYNVRLTSIGPYRIVGYFSVPKGDGPFPGLLITPRYGSVNTPPHWDDRQRYAVLTLMHRGQRLADQPFAATYPGLLTRGIDDPVTYVYRGIVADCLRWAEWLLSRAEVDTSRVGVIGDDLAVITAARRPRFSAVQVTSLMFFRLMEARLRTVAYPVEEINDELRSEPSRCEEIGRTLSYFDPIHHAPRLTGETMIAVGDPGSLGGPEWIEPLSEAPGGVVTSYAVAHEGGTDHDWMDAWMAQQLGAEPRPRRWAVQ